MQFITTELQGAYVIEPDLKHDERGYFARTYCQNTFTSYGLTSQFLQCNISFNGRKGTLRGMHWQDAPHMEAKLLRCTSGSIYDVIVDLRPTSPTFKKWIAVELSSKNYRMLYIPEGFAHGFQTLEDNTEVYYQMSDNYYADLARGIRWDDPTFKIEWPLAPTVISQKDQSHPIFV